MLNFNISKVAYSTVIYILLAHVIICMYMYECMSVTARLLIPLSRTSCGKKKENREKRE